MQELKEVVQCILDLLKQLGVAADILRLSWLTLCPVDFPDTLSLELIRCDTDRCVFALENVINNRQMTNDKIVLTISEYLLYQPKWRARNLKPASVESTGYNSPGKRACNSDTIFDNLALRTSLAWVANRTTGLSFGVRNIRVFLWQQT